MRLARAVPAGRVYTAKDIAEDPHYRARGMLQHVTLADGFELDVPGIVPKLSATPGTVRSSAPGIGDDTDAVLAEAGYSAEDIAAPWIARGARPKVAILREQGVNGQVEMAAAFDRADRQRERRLCAAA